MDKKQLIGLIGAVILFLGVFAPFINIPAFGNVNYFSNGKGDGVIIIVLAIISAVLVLTELYGGLWFTGLGSLGILAYSFINFQKRLTEAQAKIKEMLSDNPFAEVGNAMAQSVQLQWGFAILVVGAILVIAAAILNAKEISKQFPDDGSEIHSHRKEW